MELQKMYLTYYNLLMAHDLLQDYLSSLASNLSKGIHKTKCKYGQDNKKCETCRMKYKNCNCFLEYINFKDNLAKRNTKIETAFLNT